MGNDKRLFHLYAPAVGLERDVYLPVNTFIWVINKSIGELFSGLSENRLSASPDTALYKASTGEALDINQTIAALGIPSGEILLVI